MYINASIHIPEHTGSVQELKDLLDKINRDQLRPLGYELFTMSQPFPSTHDEANNGS